MRQPLEWGEIPASAATSIAPASGLPALVVPAGSMPGDQRLRLLFLGPAWSEETLQRLGYAFEVSPAGAAAPGMSEGSEVPVAGR